MKNFKKISIATIGTLTILGTSTFASTGKINAPSGLILRKEASKTGEVITTIKDKIEVEIIEKSGDWYKIKYVDNTGYLYGEYVVVSEEPVEKPVEEQTASTGTVDNNATANGNIKVYMIPVITSTVINEIEKDAEIKIEKQITNWSYVSSGNITGWVRTYALNGGETVPQQETVETSSEATAEEPKQEETTAESSISNPSNQAQTETKVDEVKGFIAVDCANVRSKPDTSVDNIVTALTRDTSFMITAETEEWYKIRYTSPSGEVYEGYVFKELVTK